MKRPILTAILSAFVSVGAALAVLTAAGGISSARSITNRMATPAPAAQSDKALPPPPEATPFERDDIDIMTGSADTSEGPRTATIVAETPLLSSDPPSAERSPAPKRAEWRDAPFVRIARATSNECKARRIREWVLLRCEISNSDSWSLIAGAREGLDFWMSSMEDSHISFVFPVRRGDRRVIQVNSMAGKYGSSPEVMISERWGEGDVGPLITVSPAF